MLHEVHGPQFVSGFWKNWTPAFIVCLIFQNQISCSDHLTSLLTRSPPESWTCPHSTVLIGFICRGFRKTMETRDFHWLYSMVRCCHQTSSRPRRVFLLGLVQMKVAADWHRHSLTCYTRVWLSTSDLPLHVHSQKLAPRFVDLSQ